MRKIKNYIKGSLSCISSEFLPVNNPSTGEIIAEVVLSNSEDFDLAVESSKKAFLEWSLYTPLKRSRIISKFKQNIEKDIENLAKLVSTEHGKTIEDSKGSVTRGLEIVEFSCSRLPPLPPAVIN